MKSTLIKGLAMMVLALSLMGMATAASAYGCRFVGGHWAYGRWVPAHRVCWGGPGPGPVMMHGCKFVPGHWYYGRWIPAHKKCW